MAKRGRTDHRSGSGTLSAVSRGRVLRMRTSSDIMDMKRSIAPAHDGDFAVGDLIAAEIPVQPVPLGDHGHQDSQPHEAYRRRHPQRRDQPPSRRLNSRSANAHKGSGWFLALTALGVVFGDIGTSPLYTFSVALNATGHALPIAADVLGVVSLIFWALMVMVSLKYVVFILRADNDGEGGILALLSLVAADRDSQRAANSAAGPPRRSIGAALLYGDGVITPAISVLSAMEGLKLVDAGHSNNSSCRSRSRS